ncbi:MAG: hypothetical protein Q8P07_04600 [bacterium]|nr:hypothetical protein [bacterium]
MSEKMEGGVPSQEHEIKAEEIFGNEYPDRRSAASAIASAIASNDPEYKQLINKSKDFDQFSKGARMARDERQLDDMKSQANNRWHDIYSKAMALAEQAMQEVADEYQGGQLEIGEGHVDDEGTKKFWRARNALGIVGERAAERLNSVKESGE